MIEFCSVKMKNFQAVGNNWLTINLNNSPTTLISGKNGSGKCVDKSTKIMVDCEENVMKEFMKFLESK